MEQSDHDYLVSIEEELAKVWSDEQLYGNGFMQYSDGEWRHIPAKDILVGLGVEVVDGSS